MATCQRWKRIRKDGQDTQDELQKRNLRAELEERERRHFSSKDKSKHATNWAKRETEDRIVPRSIDADDSDVEVNSDEARFYSFTVYLDDEEALLAELERIKKEKAEEKLRQPEKSAHPASVIEVKPGIRNELEVLS
ncbi:hypothetical protein J1N35_004424 [Gossypium stocksii]|uniref:Uncharacterized protein n=1 Tax=Gossypium stocksii TaxID=47602 RepID=A0A9D4AHN2_9ROSI|nr:hypothetical protein J1N35_004424 [Gossypium stocksii]